MIYLIFIAILLMLELVYFKIANKYNIIDKPNHRSSHIHITIRGGGVVFPVAVIIWFIYAGFQYPLYVIGLIIISLVSFIDDVRGFPKRWRLAAHVTAMALAVIQLNLLSLHWLLIAAIFVFFIGAINAYNFMDGINGITGVYSLIALLTLLWVNHYQTVFIDDSFLFIVIIAVAVFNFFNFRKKAKCFAGDVGSVSIAFIICFFLIKLILQTHDVRYLLLLAIYGVDTVYTIIIRLIKNENIFEAHRSHLYQLMVNEVGYKHLWIASFYGLAQLVVNYFVISNLAWSEYYVFAGVVITLSVVYLTMRYFVSDKKIIKTRSA